MAIQGGLAALGTGGCWACGSMLFATAGRRMGPVVLNRLRISVAAMWILALLRSEAGASFNALRDRAGAAGRGSR